LTEKVVLEVRASGGGFVRHRPKRELALHVVEGKVSTIIRLHYVLVEARRALRTKLVTDVYVLRWGSLSSLERRGAVQHRVRSARTAVEFTWLGVHKNLVSSLDRGEGPAVLNDGESGLELVRHLL
jgi:hypothetical protein